jgi:uncharacterized membrane protein
MLFTAKNKFMPQLIFSIFLILHIISGSTGLIAGTIAMASKKSGPIHRLAGKIFFYAMAAIFVTSIYMSIAHNNLFLLLVGFFSFYLAVTGYRILYLKTLHFKQVQPKLVDYCISATGLLAGIALLVLSVVLFSKVNMFGVVTLSFGCLSVWFGYSDLIKFKHPPTNKKHWIISHGMRMAGAYTATITAFVVVNVQIKQGWILWLLPAILVIPIAKRVVNKFINKAV